MCGRYVLKTGPVELKRELELTDTPELSARYNIAPTQPAPVVLDAAPKRLTVAQWGLLPRWAKSAGVANQFVNARVESLSKNATYRELLQAHRCLVPLDGFYEWLKDGRVRRPHFLHAGEGVVLTMAGLWNRWRSPEGIEVDTFTVLTTPASPEVAVLHDRMPAIIEPRSRQRWLSGPVEGLVELLRPWLGLRVQEVSPRVNSVTIDDERCLEPPATVQLRLL